VKITLHKAVTLCSIYIPPRSEICDRELDDLLNQLPSPVLLLGDFNAHSVVWGGQGTDDRGQKLEDFVARQDLCILNDRSFTYLHPATGSFTSIDLSICSPSLFMDLNWEVGKDQCGSDHFPIFIHTNPPAEPERPPKWLLHKADWSAFQTLCAQEINRETFKELNNPLDLFSACLIDIASETVPKSSTTSKHIHKPWFTNDCKKAVKERKNALLKFTTEPTQANLAKYRLARAQARRIIKESKRKSWKEYVSKLNMRSSVKKTWDMVRKISGKQQTNTTVYVNKTDGNKATDKVDIANTLADEFEKNSSSEHYSEQFQRFKRSQERKRLKFESNNTESYNAPFNIKELKESINKAHDTAVGPDDVHYQFLKHLPEESLIVLLDAFNNVWETGVLPDAWREATVIPIPKPGKEPSNPTNYRPIALTSCLCKTMERMINARLVWYLEKNHLITKAQSGFRHFRSTTDHLITLESNIRDAFVRGEHVVSVFFDLEKAYDTTWKYGILKDLHEMGLRGRMPLFIKDFLTDRRFKVRIGATLSELHRQEMGVPQGSILSVTLFSVKINNIVKTVKTGIDNSLFVDDFAISCKSKNMATIERQLQLCLNKIQTWADQNGFKFSQSKTVCVHFCNKRKLHLDPVLKIYGHEIPVVEQVKFLGLIFDQKLNFKAHIDYLRVKCQKSLNLLRVVSKMDWGADRKVLLRLYRSLIRSKLDYGCIVYGSARKSYLKKLETIQNQALRICLGAFRTSPIPSLHVEADELPLHLRREKLSVQYALKLGANPENPAYDATFKAKNEQFYNSKPNAIRSFALRIKEPLNEICPNMKHIAQYLTPSIPPWKLKLPTIDLSLSSYPKESTHPLVFQSLFDNLRDSYTGYKAIYTDGSKDNDRTAAAAVSEGLNVQVRLLDGASIYTAELRAIQRALDIASASDEQSFIIFSDSLSSLTALKGYNFDNPDILKIVTKCHFLIQNGKSIVFAWCPSHIGIVGNERADRLAKKALNHRITEAKIPYTDLKPQVNAFIFDKWQSSWNEQTNNKLHSIRPNLKTLWPHGHRISRREEVVLARSRIGHTHITHSFLLKGEPMPQCIPCAVPFTVSHVLLDCIDFDVSRVNYFDVNSLYELFQKVDPSSLLDFIREIGLFYKF